MYLDRRIFTNPKSKSTLSRRSMENDSFFFFLRLASSSSTPTRFIRLCRDRRRRDGIRMYAIWNVVIVYGKRRPHCTAVETRNRSQKLTQYRRPRVCFRAPSNPCAALWAHFVSVTWNPRIFWLSNSRSTVRVFKITSARYLCPINCPELFASRVAKEISRDEDILVDRCG